MNRHLPFGAKFQSPNKIIVHSMGEIIIDKIKYSAVEWLEKLRLSAHALITPDGEVMRCREDHEGAYHARGFNTDSLGVEFLVPGKHNYSTFLKEIEKDWVTDAQYEAGTVLLKNWMAKFNINRVERHSDVSPGRKVDPGNGFKWNDFLRGLSD